MGGGRGVEAESQVDIPDAERRPAQRKKETGFRTVEYRTSMCQEPLQLTKYQNVSNQLDLAQQGIYLSEYPITTDRWMGSKAKGG